MEKLQPRKSATWKKYNMEKVQHGKSTARKNGKSTTSKSATWKKHNMKKCNMERV